MSAADQTPLPSALPSLAQATRFWLLLGFISFGGPTGQIAIMHTELVEKRRWIDEKRFLHALNFCMLLPGPEAQQLATYCGWLLHGVRGGLIAGMLFVIPSAVILWALSWIYAAHGDAMVVSAAFDGLKPAVVAIVIAALIKLSRRILRTPLLVIVAAAAFVAIYGFSVPFPLIILTAGGLGLILGRSAPNLLALAQEDGQPAFPALDRRRLALHLAAVLLVGSVVWQAPVIVAGTWLGWHHVLPQQGLFFSKAAMVTFGGAYSVLPYVAQHAVEHHGWLTSTDMLNGLGLAETTPGPLIMVLQFVGFMGGWNHPDPVSPLTAATLAAAMTTWTTFVPCFIWIFAFAPWVERIRRIQTLRGALSVITSAVVGVVLNLAVWFSSHVVMQPSAGWNVDAYAVAVILIALLALLRLKAGIPLVVLFGVLAGLARHLAAG